MTKAPSRIWLTTTEGGNVDDWTQWLDMQDHLHPDAPRTEYVRADLCDPLSDPRVKALEGEREMREDAQIRLSEMRMCLNCGRKTSKDHNRAMPLPGCPSPDACAFDLTPDEAWQHWRHKAHDLREALTAISKVPRSEAAFAVIQLLAKDALAAMREATP